MAEIYIVFCASLLLGPLLRLLRRTAGSTSTGMSRAFWWFIAISAVSSVIAVFTENFVVPSDAESLLKQPGWISLSRVIQLLMAFFCFQLIYAYSRASHAFLRRGVRMYVFAAVLFSIYGIVSWVLFVTIGFDIGGAYGDEGVRLRALFVEGGPFGMYAASAIVLVLGQRGSRFLSPWQEICSWCLLVVALMLSQSKAGTIAAIAALLLAFLLSIGSTLRRYRGTLLSGAVIAVALLIASDTFSQLGNYVDQRQLLIDSADLYKDDPNIAMGRIAGAVVVPTMIEAHPLIGVGLGNYSLLRDSRAYISGMPVVDAWDLHGLGLFGFAAEVGILGVLCFVVVFTRLIKGAKSRRVGLPLTVCASFPLMTFLFGTQPTFIYPWILAAFVCAMLDRLPAPVRIDQPRRRRPAAILRAAS